MGSVRLTGVDECHNRLVKTTVLFVVLFRMTLPERSTFFKLHHVNGMKMSVFLFLDNVNL